MFFGKRQRRDAQPVSIPTYRQAMPRFALELRRSRRYQHPLTVLVIGPEPTGLSPNGGGANDQKKAWEPETGSLWLFLGSLLRDAIRETDVLAQAALDGVYAVMLTDSGPEEATQAARRFDDSFHERTGARLRIGLATFPDDGLTFPDLYGHASDARDRSPVAPDPEPTQPKRDASNA